MRPASEAAWCTSNSPLSPLQPGLGARSVLPHHRLFPERWEFNRVSSDYMFLIRLT